MIAVGIGNFGDAAGIVSIESITDAVFVGQDICAGAGCKCKTEAVFVNEFTGGIFDDVMGRSISIRIFVFCVSFSGCNYILQNIGSPARTVTIVR